MKKTTHILTVAVAAFMMASAVTAQSLTMNDFKLSEDSRMWVEGTSTIHDWECPVNEVDGSISAAEDTSGLSAIGLIEVRVKVDDIVCEKSKMNKKLRKAFDMDENPMIEFTADSAEVTESEGIMTAASTGMLSMAGENRHIEVTAEMTMTDEDRWMLKGRVPILQTDFDIDPPTALFGTLKSGDEVFINFEVLLDPVEIN